MNIINKMLFSYVFIIVLPVLIAGYYSYNALSSGVYREYHKMSTNVNDLLSKNLDFHFKLMDNTANLIVNNIDLVREIEKANKITDENATLEQQSQKLKSTQKIEQALISITSLQDSCVDVGLYSLQGNIYHTSKFNLGLQMDTQKKYRSMSWFIEAVNKDGKRSFLGTHQQMQTIKGTNVISMTKLLKTELQSSLGVILIDYDLNVFRNVYSLISLNHEDNIFIADENGIIVYEKDEQLIGKKIPNNLYSPIYEKKQKQFSTEPGKDGYFVAASTEKMSGWNFISVLSNKNLLKNFSSLQKIFILIMSISFILISLVYYIIVKSVFNPMKRLATKMNMAAKGDLSIRFETHRNDEVGIIGKSFNYMISSIAALINEQKKIEKKLRQSEIQALQAQINPHFMYNTLNTVKWLAIEIKADKIKGMVEALVSLLKNTIYRKGRLLTIEKELANLESFVHILNIRYDGRFKLAYSIAEDLKKYYILKMLLQPIVENSIFHGFEDENQTDCEIKVSCKLIDKRVFIEISDNGKGMNEEELGMVLFSEGNSRSNFSGIGVSNVNERIQLNYGNEYGLKITSTPGAGTTVTLILPVLENEEDTENA